MELIVFNRVPTISSIADVSLFRYESSSTQTFTISDDDAADDFTITITNRADDSATSNPPFSLDLTNYPC